jgi:hypothetical protein
MTSRRHSSFEAGATAMARSRSFRSTSELARRFLDAAGRAIAYPFLVLVGVLVALGVLRMGPVGTVLVGAGSAALGIWLARTGRAGPVGRWVGDLSDAGGAAAGTVGVAALVGWTQVQHEAAVLGLIVTCGGALVLRRRLLLSGGQTGGCCADALAAPKELADLLGRLPTDVLLAEWQRTGAAIAGHPGLVAEAALVRLRAILLDELEARDAKGFSAWQRAAGERPCPPAPFLGDGA